MPDAGMRSLAEYPDRTIVSAGRDEGWDLSRALVISITTEVTTATALSLLPAQLARPIPPYVKLVIIDAPETPLGPYREAMLLLGARELAMTRAMLVDSIVQGEQQLAAARRLFGGSRRLGTVHIDDQRELLHVEIADEQGALCTINIEALHRVEATMLRFDSVLVAGESDGEPALLQGGIRVMLEESEGRRSQHFEVQMHRHDSLWWRVRPVNNVIAFMADGHTRMEPAHAPAVKSSRARFGP